MNQDNHLTMKRNKPLNPRILEDIEEHSEDAELWEDYVKRLERY